MRRIADTKQTRFVPRSEADDLHGQQLYLVPIPQFLNAPVKKGGNLPDRLAELIDATVLQLFERALLNDQPSLEISAAVYQNECAAVVDVPEHFVGIVREA